MGNARGCLACGNGIDIRQQLTLPDGVIALDSKRFIEAAELAARSFAGTASTDPEWTIDWALGPHLRGKWDDPRRMEVCKWLQTMLLHICVDQGGVVLATEREGGRLGAVCMAVPYLNGKTPYGTFGAIMCYLRHARQLGLPPQNKKPMWKDIGKGIDKRMDFLGESVKEIHHKHAPGDHWYVQVMAVDTDAQGNGYCGKLMRTVSGLADSASVPCYLETSGPRNVAIYERFGYKTEGKYTHSCDADPDKAKPYDDFFAMVRPVPGQMS
eukprot:TRINITY_DN65987_c0_g1_i1.p1 TRINITY_DN65987_c0_g1~~TRINITY_DN65987_c0_g1_i1.p1  ORF type:complete len:269 (-),score=39.41 TRINITY_DN65987_c0_g1_i1:890-1696(-)